METIEQLQRQMGEHLDKAQAIAKSAEAAERDMNPEERSACDDELAAIDEIKPRKAALEAQREEDLVRRERIASSLAELQRSTGRRVRPQQGTAEDRTRNARPKARPSLDIFKGEGGYELATTLGYLAHAVNGNRTAMSWLDKNAGGFLAAEHLEKSDATGGILVFDEISMQIVDLVKRYGVARANCQVMPMASDTKTFFRKTARVTTAAVGELKAIGATVAKWVPEKLVAQKLGGAGIYSKEIQEDAMANFGEIIARDLATDFAKQPDEALFKGDGTSTYFGIKGLLNKIGSAGINEAAGATLASITLQDFLDTIALLPDFASETNNQLEADIAWYCNRSFYYEVMLREIIEVGGTTPGDIVNGAVRGVGGFPVRFVNSMPKASAASTIFAYLGNMRMAAAYGERRAVTIASSTEATIGGVNLFEQEAIAVIGTMRFDINCHSVGDATDPGPIVALKTTA